METRHVRDGEQRPLTSPRQTITALRRRRRFLRETFFSFIFFVYLFFIIFRKINKNPAGRTLLCMHIL